MFSNIRVGGVKFFTFTRGPQRHFSFFDSTVDVQPSYMQRTHNIHTLVCFPVIGWSILGIFGYFSMEEGGVCKRELK